jgi:hypothetical protein
MKLKRPNALSIRIAVFLSALAVAAAFFTNADFPRLESNLLGYTPPSPQNLGLRMFDMGGEIPFKLEAGQHYHVVNNLGVTDETAFWAFGKDLVRNGGHDGLKQIVAQSINEVYEDVEKRPAGNVIVNSDGSVKVGGRYLTADHQASAEALAEFLESRGFRVSEVTAGRIFADDLPPLGQARTFSVDPTNGFVDDTAKAVQALETGNARTLAQATERAAANAAATRAATGAVVRAVSGLWGQAAFAFVMPTEMAGAFYQDGQFREKDQARAAYERYVAAGGNIYTYADFLEHYLCGGTCQDDTTLKRDINDIRKAEYAQRQAQAIQGAPLATRAGFIFRRIVASAFPATKIFTSSAIRDSVARDRAALFVRMANLNSSAVSGKADPRALDTERSALYTELRNLELRIAENSKVLNARPPERFDLTGVRRVLDKISLNVNVAIQNPGATLVPVTTNNPLPQPPVAQQPQPQPPVVQQPLPQPPIAQQPQPQPQSPVQQPQSPTGSTTPPQVCITPLCLVYDGYTPTSVAGGTTVPTGTLTPGYQNVGGGTTWVGNQNIPFAQSGSGTQGQIAGQSPMGTLTPLDLVSIHLQNPGTIVAPINFVIDSPGPNGTTQSYFQSGNVRLAGTGIATQTVISMPEYGANVRGYEIKNEFGQVVGRSPISENHPDGTTGYVHISAEPGTVIASGLLWTDPETGRIAVAQPGTAHYAEAQRQFEERRHQLGIVDTRDVALKPEEPEVAAPTTIYLPPDIGSGTRYLWSPDSWFASSSSTTVSHPVGQVIIETIQGTDSQGSNYTISGVGGTSDSQSNSNGTTSATNSTTQASTGSSGTGSQSTAPYGGQSAQQISGGGTANFAWDGNGYYFNGAPLSGDSMNNTYASALLMGGGIISGDGVSAASAGGGDCGLKARAMGTCNGGQPIVGGAINLPPDFSPFPPGWDPLAGFDAAALQFSGGSAMVAADAPPGTGDIVVPLPHDGANQFTGSSSMMAVDAPPGAGDVVMPPPHNGVNQPVGIIQVDFDPATGIFF